MSTVPVTYKQAFPALQGLVQRDRLDVPIIGVLKGQVFVPMRCGLDVGRRASEVVGDDQPTVAS
jgi:hypothetical protein